MRIEIVSLLVIGSASHGGRTRCLDDAGVRAPVRFRPGLRREHKVSNRKNPRSTFIATSSMDSSPTSAPLLCSMGKTPCTDLLDLAHHGKLVARLEKDLEPSENFP